VLARCLAHGIRIVSNFGAANPRGAARRIAALAAELGLKAPRIAVVEGDDVGAARSARCCATRSAPSADLDAVMQTMVCANAYLGADAIADALLAGADIVVTGRVADPSLTVGPRSPTSAGAATTGTGSRARPWPATCSNAARRSPAATTRTRATRTSPASPGRLPDRRDRRRRPLHDHQAAGTGGGSTRTP
jgi:hypothetical protein